MATTSDVGSTLLTSLTGSSFDIGNISKVMAEAEVAGPRAIIEKNQEKTNTELDALKYLETNLTAFNTYLTDLSSPDLFTNKSATSSAEGVVTVSAQNTAAIASYQIESQQLAQAHTLVANKTYASPSDTISTGTLSISIGGNAQDIWVDSSNNTLEGLQKVINNGDYGVTASIINNAGSYQMMFSSEDSGAASEMTISGLADFDTNGLTTTSNGQDAVMVLNGLTVTSSTNTFDDLIEGVSFTLNSADVGAPKTVSVGQDADAVMETVTSFVDVYNQLDTILDELSKYDKSDLTQAELDSEEYAYYGDLAGSSMLRTVRSDIKESLSGAIEEISGNYNSLGVVGLSFDRKGALELDSDKLRNIVENDMQAVGDLFAKGGSSDDPLINFLAGTEKTVTGSYELNITQLAERATVSSGATSPMTLSNDERVAGDKILDSAGALTIGAGATFDLTIDDGVNPATTNTIDLSLDAGSFATKEDLATAVQSRIDAQFGANVASFLYDASQARFEITANSGEGAVDMSAISGMSNLGFNSTSYSGAQSIDLSANDAKFNIEVDESVSTAITVGSGRYTQDELATQMANNINANTDVKAAGASVSVSVNATSGELEVSSNRFGGFSKVDMSGFANFANAGFSEDLNDTGLNVDGTLTTDAGTLNIGAYATSEDGRQIKVSNFAVVGGEAADVRGLEFEVLGGSTGVRGNLTYAQGFASRLSETITNFFDKDTGLVSQRISSLNDKNDDYTKRNEKLDSRYEKQELKYKLQFAALQSIMSSAQATRDQLSAQFNPSN